MNKKIKEEIRKAGLFQYQIANKMGVSEQTLIRWLRFDISDETAAAIRRAIDELSAQKEAV